jgi:hypothetical protein
MDSHVCRMEKHINSIHSFNTILNKKKIIDGTQSIEFCMHTGMSWHVPQFHATCSFHSTQPPTKPNRNHRHHHMQLNFLPLHGFHHSQLKMPLIIAALCHYHHHHHHRHPTAPQQSITHSKANYDQTGGKFN